MNLDSSKIKVFPSARRNYSGDQFSRLMSESSLVSIVNKLVDTDGFVITSSYTADSPIEFNIHGYYFNVSDVDDITDSFSSLSTGGKVYAIITLSSATTGGVTFTELSGIDDNLTNKYEGVTFDTSSGSGSLTYSLPILQKTSSGWKIPEASLIKFNTDGGLI